MEISDHLTLEDILDIIKGLTGSPTLREKKRIKQLLHNISDDTIINTIGMADMPLIAYVFKMKYGKIRTHDLDHDVVLQAGKRCFANISYLAVFIHFLDIENNVLSIEGNISFPSVLGENVSFFSKTNEKKIYPTLHDRGMDLFVGKQMYESRKVFRFSVCLKDACKTEFYYCYNGIDIKIGKINSMRFCPVADIIPDQYAEIDGWGLRIKEACLYCYKLNEEREDVFERDYRDSLKRLFPNKATWIIALREDYFKKKRNKKKPIWIFMDRSENADDNAFVLFKYMQKHPEINSYFVLSKDSDDYEKVKQIGRVVDLYSEDHFKLFLSAEYVISSQCNGVVENPFWEDAEYFRDIYHRPKMIFLQHGVIKDDMSPTLNRYNTNFTGFITSTLDEYNSIIQYPYFYSDKEVWLTGLPRFDKLHNDRNKMIILMPSWRKQLMVQKWNENSENMEWILKNHAEDSQFFVQYRSLVSNEKFLSLCHRHGYKSILAIHPLLKQYAYMIVDRTECELADSTMSYNELFAKGSILITDYSSVAFDFSILRKPVIYYQFDKQSFYAGHTYKKGYFDYERDGLGKVCYTEEALLHTLASYLENDCHLEDLYEERINQLWRQEGSCCEHVYNRIIEDYEGIYHE